MDKSRCGAEGVPYRLIAIVGPTATGKSELADSLAFQLGAQVLSCDSMQVYRGMDIGTAKTDPGLRRVALHGVDLVDIDCSYSASLFADYAHRLIDSYVNTNSRLVLCGGTGLYVRAALEDMTFGQLESAHSYEESEATPQELYRLLESKDPESASLIHPNNTRRVMRALDLLDAGSSYAQIHTGLSKRLDRYPTLYIGLELDRAELYRRINARVDEMMSAGLLEEVENLHSKGFGDTARQAIGYKELIEYLDGKIDLDEAVQTIKKRSRQYAKRQYSWFRADSRIHWYDVGVLDRESICRDVISQFLLSAQPVSE